MPPSVVLFFTTTPAKPRTYSTSGFCATNSKNIVPGASLAAFWILGVNSYVDCYGSRQGKPTEALAKYDEALKYAPNWKQLKEAREAMAKKSS